MRTDVGLLVLRLTAALLMLHGWGKLSNLIHGETAFADPIGIGPLPSLILATFAEFFCALAVLVGFQTRWATIPPLITMLVGALIVHGSDPWRTKELAVVYAGIFLALAFTGGGKYSLEVKLRGNRR